MFCQDCRSKHTMQYITLQRPCPSSNLYRWSTIITTASSTNNHVNISVSNQRWKDVVFESSSMLLQYWLKWKLSQHLCRSFSYTEERLPFILITMSIALLLLNKIFIRSTKCQSNAEWIHRRINDYKIADSTLINITLINVATIL